MKKYLIALLVLTAIGTVSFFATKVGANMSSFYRFQTAVATTTSTYMIESSATATSTLTMDTSLSGASGFAMDSAILLVQFTATSTVSSPILSTRIEYSQDNIDWYPMSTSDQLATSTSQYISEAYMEYIWKMSTSTNTFLMGGSSAYTSGAATTTKMMQTINVKTPTKYVRAKFSIPSGGGKGALWAEFIGKKQTTY